MILATDHVVVGVLYGPWRSITGCSNPKHIITVSNWPPSVQSSTSICCHQGTKCKKGDDRRHGSRNCLQVRTKHILWLRRHVETLYESIRSFYLCDPGDWVGKGLWQVAEPWFTPICSMMWRHFIFIFCLSSPSIHENLIHFWVKEWHEYKHNP